MARTKPRTVKVSFIRPRSSHFLNLIPFLSRAKPLDAIFYEFFCRTPARRIVIRRSGPRCGCSLQRFAVRLNHSTTNIPALVQESVLDLTRLDGSPPLSVQLRQPVSYKAKHEIRIEAAHGPVAPSPCLRLEDVAIDADGVSLSAASTRPSAACPACGRRKARLHGHSSDVANSRQSVEQG